MRQRCAASKRFHVGRLTWLEPSRAWPRSWTPDIEVYRTDVGHEDDMRTHARIIGSVLALLAGSVFANEMASPPTLRVTGTMSRGGNRVVILKDVGPVYIGQQFAITNSEGVWVYLAKDITDAGLTFEFIQYVDPNGKVWNKAEWDREMAAAMVGPTMEPSTAVTNLAGVVSGDYILPSWGNGAPKLAITLTGEWQTKREKGPDFDVYWFGRSTTGGRPVSFGVYVGHNPHAMDEASGMSVTNVLVGSNMVRFVVNQQNDTLHADGIVSNVFQSFEGPVVSDLLLHFMVNARSPTDMEQCFVNFRTLRPSIEANKVPEDIGTNAPHPQH